MGEAGSERQDASSRQEILRDSRGQTYDVVDPRVVSKEEAAPLITGSLRKVFPRLPFEQAVLLRRG